MAKLPIITIVEENALACSQEPVFTSMPLSQFNSVGADETELPVVLLDRHMSFVNKTHPQGNNTTTWQMLVYVFTSQQDSIAAQDGKEDSITLAYQIMRELNNRLQNDSRIKLMVSSSQGDEILNNNKVDRNLIGLWFGLELTIEDNSSVCLT